MTSYLKSILEKKYLLEDLNQLTYDEQKQILNDIDPDQFSDMIYVFPFYYQHPKFESEFKNKVKEITNWNVYFNHNLPEQMINLFFKIADESVLKMDQALYYLYFFKVPVQVLKNNFLKIYDYAVREYDEDPRKMRKESTLFNGIFVAYSVEQLRNILDFLMDEMERYDGIENMLNNPYSEVLLILIDFSKTIDKLYEKENNIFTKNRLNRLSKFAI